MFDVMGFGKLMDQIPMLLQARRACAAWGSVVRQLAAGLLAFHLTAVRASGSRRRGLQHCIGPYRGQRRAEVLGLS